MILTARTHSFLPREVAENIPSVARGVVETWFLTTQDMLQYQAREYYEALSDDAPDEFRQSFHDFWIEFLNKQVAQMLSRIDFEERYEPDDEDMAEVLNQTQEKLNQARDRIRQLEREKREAIARAESAERDALDEWHKRCLCEVQRDAEHQPRICQYCGKLTD